MDYTDAALPMCKIGDGYNAVSDCSTYGMVQYQNWMQAGLPWTVGHGGGMYFCTYNSNYKHMLYSYSGTQSGPYSTYYSSYTDMVNCSFIQSQNPFNVYLSGVTQTWMNQAATLGGSSSAYTSYTVSGNPTIYPIETAGQCSATTCTQPALLCLCAGTSASGCYGNGYVNGGTPANGGTGAGGCATSWLTFQIDTNAGQFVAARPNIASTQPADFYLWQANMNWLTPATISALYRGCVAP
jgi:hypothetical protein